MGNLYIIRDYYEPNTASINRSLALTKGYGELGIKTELVFIFPNYKNEKVNQQFLNVKFTYLWEKYCPKNKYLKHIVCRILLLDFILKLKSGDKIILYGTLNPWYLFLFNSKISIYNEIAEHPSVHTERSGLIGKAKYILFKKFCQRIDGVLPITPSLSNFFINEFGVKAEKVCTINMIVDSSRFDNIEIKTKTNTISYCGTISERKDGISDLLKAFKVVSARHKNIVLKLIGGFENKTTQENVNNLVQTLGIQDRVLITGIVEADQMPELLSEARVLVLSRPQSTQAQYGFPTKLGEYLMTENPIVVTDVGDFSLYLTNKENIIFAEPDNAEDFAKKLLWVLDNYEEAKEIGIKGKELALKSFNYKIEAQKVLNFIKI